MKNDIFNVTFDKNQGTVTSITLNADEHKMNFVGEIGNWGRIICENRLSRFSYNLPKSNVDRKSVV